MDISIDTAAEKNARDEYLIWKFGYKKVMGDFQPKIEDCCDLCGNERFLDERLDICLECYSK